MQKLITTIIMILLSAGATGQEYARQTSSGDFILSASTGRVEIENLEGKESIHSLGASMRVDSMPLEFELRYSTVDWNPTITFVSGGTVVGSEKINGTIKNIGIGGKLDLSWHCTAACVYLMAGYNTADLTVDEYDVSVDADFPHWGAGARYDFTSGLRATVEYYSYNIGEHDGIDYGTATAVQAGIGYRF